MMFFSERDLFSIDLYLADARTGKILRKITNTATNPHFESLPVPDLRRRVGCRRASGSCFRGISKGSPVLTIVEADSGKNDATRSR